MSGEIEIELNAEDQRFVDEVADFVDREIPRDLRLRLVRGYSATRQDIVFLLSKLNERGWAAPGWPVKYGGTGWTPWQRHLFEETMVAHDAPVSEFDFTNLVGPVIYTFGTDKQKRRFLPAMLRGEEFWCQGFSEPNSGSDLSSLRTSAIRDGDDYVVNGQKIWTSRAHYSDWIFMLVRTDPQARRSKGISFLLIDMKTLGVAVRPIRTLNDEYFLNETFFEDVRVPVANLVGAEGEGWAQARLLLTNERSRAAHVPYSKRDLAFLKQALRQGDGQAASPMLADPLFRERLTQAEIDLLALEASTMRVLGQSRDADAAASLLKIRGSEMRQQTSELMVDALGGYAMPYYPDPEEGHPLAIGPDWAPGAMCNYLHRRATTIYGGTNEIQRTLIAKNILGLSN